MSTPQRSQAKESPHAERKRQDQAKALAQSETLPSLAIQQTLADPSAATPASLLSLQQSHGNRAVQNLIQRQPVEEEELLQMKPAGPTPSEVIQRQSLEEEELLQMKPAGPTPDGLIQRRQDEDKRRKDEGVQPSMEGAFGNDFSGVRVHSATGAPAMGAQAYTRGDNVHFAPGAYAPNAAPAGSAVMGHELAHVVQQRAGRLRDELQMKPDGGAQEGGALTPEITDEIQRQRGNGPTLAAGVQAQMESALGADFSQVHVHADAQADELSRALNARAFTIGSDVFFRDGLYDPNGPDGQELLAHELTHVVQQTGGGSAPAAPQTKLTLGPVGDQYEQEADRVAQSLTTPNATDARPNRVQRASVIQRFSLKDLFKRKTPAPTGAPTAPTNPAPSNPAPTNPAPSNPAPSNLAPTNATPSNPAPSNPAPTNPAPTNPAPINPAPTPLTPDQVFQKYGSAGAATQKAEAVGGHWGFGLATGLAGGASGLKAMGSGIAGLYGREEGDINEANKVSAGFGIAGGAMGTLGGLASTVGSSMELAGKASALRRGLALRSQGGLAGKQLGQQMRRRGGIGVAQKSLGVLGGLSAMGGGISSIGAGARTLQSGKADDSGAADFTTAGNAFGVASGGLTMLSEGLNIGSGIASLRSASRRSKAATTMATQFGAAGANQDTEMADIATFVSQNQNKGGKGLGLAASASNWIGGALGTAGSAAGLGKANLASTVLGGLSTGFGLLGTALSAHAGRKNAAKAEANKAAADAKAAQLADKLKAGNANAIKFAREALGVQGTDDELKQMGTDDAEALKELLVQKMMKYG
jgi:hypothetical protein